MREGIVQSRENTKERTEKLGPTGSGCLGRNQKKKKMEESKAKDENVIKNLEGENKETKHKS
jgi:hypothetical protein